MGFNHDLEVMKNMTHIEKCLEFDAVTLTFTKKVLKLILGKKHVLHKKGVFYLASKSMISVENGAVFFIKNPRKGGVFQTLVQASYTL